MFDYQTSKHAHFDAACRAFALSHNLEDVATAVGMRPQILRNKLNPVQPHRLTCDELLAITDYTEDARLLDGMLGQINCLPSVPVNNATEANMQFCALTATASVGAIAGEAVSTECMTSARRTQILDRARDAIRSLSVLAYTVESRITQAGDWVRQTDQAIDESSMTRVIKADTESRELVSRDTTIKATDNTRVLGTATLMAGAIQQVSAGDYSQAVKGNWLASVSGNAETRIAGNRTMHAGGDLTEQIGKIRKSVAAIQQQIIAPVVWIGSCSINVAQLMLDTLDVLKELAEQTASHTHSNTGAPTNAGAIRGAGQKADQLNGKYSPVIGQ